MISNSDHIMRLEFLYMDIRKISMGSHLNRDLKPLFEDLVQWFATLSID